MKPKKFLAGVGALLLCSILLLPIQVQATGQSEQATTITTKVPDTHTVLLEIGGHGSVIINGRAYTTKDKSVEIERLKEQSYTIQPDNGWQVESVSYGQKDAQEAVRLTDNSFTAPAVCDNDNRLTITFKKAPFSGGNGTDSTDKPTTPDKGGNTHTGVQTGDNTHVQLWGTVAVMALAGIVLTAGMKWKKSR